MKVFLNKDVEKVGMAGEVIKVEAGFARNFLFPRKLAVEITPTNEKFYANKIRQVVHRKEVVNSKTSILAENIKSLKITIKRKLHDDGKLYGAISSQEIADLLGKQGINVSKSQVLIDKSIKSKGTHEVTIKLTSQLKPTMTVVVVSE
jgi:large subunit ribosomal protein L9